jgi:N-acetylneuraminate synthase
MITLLNSVVHGAEVIEKHFTLDKSLEGNDHYHAMEPEDVRTFRENVDILTATTGQMSKKPIDAEEDSREFARRSLVANRELPKGEEITREDLSIKRPGTGISPKMIDIVIGRSTQRQVREDKILAWDDI